MKDVGRSRSCVPHHVWERSSRTRGERIRIDLDDDRLTISGSDSAPTGTVTGVVLQLGRLEPAGPVSMVVPVSVPADTPTDDVAGDVLVVFVVDPTD
ncbi:hypothetical protein MTX80_02320 [Gordonia amicalis]|nr:hypothetical protein [Gordonia amicalis]UOG21975.1 hypothetical protein MTX80_02320 [Gordonia amicalis]